MKNKTFKFVYSCENGEIPEALYLRANNITNAKIEWGVKRKNHNTLLAIFCEGKEVWKNKEYETNYRLDVIK
jgi:hypothetical protein